MLKNLLYNIDCQKAIPKLPDNFIDLVVTSCPYNIDLGNNKYNKTPYDMYNDNKDHKDFIADIYKTFQLLYPKLKSGGRVCINIGDGQNGRVPTHSDVIQALCRGKYIPLTYAIWNKNQTSNRAAWGSYMSPSCPSFPFNFEYILVFCKDTRKLTYRGETDITKEEFIAWTNPIWSFKPETKTKNMGGVAMFPEELPKRCIKMFSWKHAWVLDPYAGLHTTGLVCKKLERNYIGFELSSAFHERALKRMGQ